MKKVLLTILCILGVTYSNAQLAFTTNPNSNSTITSTPQLPKVLKPSELVEESKRSGFSFEEQTFFDRSNARYNLDLNHRNVVRNASIINLDTEHLQRFRTSDHSTFSLRLPLTANRDIQLELVEVNIFTDDFKVVTDVNPEGIEVDLGKHYRGVVKGVEGSIAALSVFDDEVMAVFSTPQDGNFVFGKLENQSNVRSSVQHILYKDRDMLIDFGFECGTVSEGREYTPDEIQDVSESRALTDCVRFYYEAEQDIAQNRGGEQGATNYITGMHNQVATLYANENINTRISQVFVWTNPDPYTSNSTDALLTGFQNNRANFNGDLSMLLTFRDIGGGIAYVDAVCNQGFAFGVSGVEQDYQNVPTYSWTVEVVAHEFGHEFGSDHTHACVWNGNGTAIDGCVDTEGNCPNPGIPNNGGTVMSYCHLADGVGINFANGFGPQPGALIRNRVENANCLQACDNNNNQPDYRATNFNGPNNADPGANITMNLRIENIGNAAGNGNGGQDRFYLNNSADLNGNPIQLGNGNTASLAAGQGFDINSGNLTIPQNTNPGNYFIVFFIDSDNVVNESNENNNVVSHQITIGGGGGGGLNCDNAVTLNCGQVYNGTTIGMPSNVQNYNNCGEDWLESGPEAVHRINWPGGNFTATLSNMAADLDIALLRSCDVNDCVTIADETINTNLNAGTYYIVVDGYEGAQSAYTLTIGDCGGGGNQADYRATNFNGPNNVDPGGTIVMNVRIENIGNAAGDGNGGQDRFYLNNSPDLNGNPVQLSNGNTASLAAGQGFDVNSGNLTIPQNTNPGNYYILFFIDSDNVVNESNENNNVVSHQITVNGGGGGGLDCNNAITLNCGQVYNGTTIGKPSNVQDYNNCGEQWVESGPEAVHIINWPGGNFTAQLSNMNEDLDMALLRTCNTNDCVTIADEIINTDLNAGTYYLVVEGYEGAQSAYTLTIGECGGGGNQPDYRPTNLNGPNNVNPGGTIVMNVRIENIGNTAGNGNGGQDRFYLNNSQNLNGNPVQLGTGNTASLAAGQGFDVSSGNLTIPQNTNPGTYYILFFIDANNVVNESNENNNIVSHQITVNGGGGGTPDYDVSNYTLDGNSNTLTVSPGQTVLGSLTIQNTGNGNATQATTGKYYYSTDNSIDVGDIVVGTDNVNPLAAGQQITETENIVIPANAQIGSRFLFYKIDADNMINESNEGNNIGLVKLNVIAGSAPVANFTVDKTNPCVGETIRFTSTSTGNPTSYNWSFPGGTPNSSTSANPTVSYSRVGTYTVSLTVTNNSGSNTKTQSNYITVQQCSQSQMVALQPGWNMISSYIQPGSTNLVDIFGPVQNQIAIVKNGVGNVYVPSAGINTIGNWNVTHGYQVKVIGNSNLNLQMVGQKADLNSLVINLSLGWNLFAYLRDTEQSIITALAPVQTSLIIVKNNSGQVYLPSAGINNIGNMKPGQGYQAKMSANASLSYNTRMAGPPANMHQASLVPTHYVLNHAQNGNNASLIISDDEMLKLGDEIGVFTKEGVLVGSAVYEGHTLAFPIWGDDSNTPEVEGLREGAEFAVKVWRSNTEQEEEFEMAFEVGNQQYYTDAIIQGSLQKTTNIGNSLESNSLKIYPNPSKSQATLSLELINPAEVNVDLYSLQGKLIQNISKEYLSIGKHEIGISTNHLPAGLYHCHVVVGGIVHNIPLGIIK